LARFHVGRISDDGVSSTFLDSFKTEGEAAEYIDLQRSNDAAAVDRGQYYIDDMEAME